MSCDLNDWRQIERIHLDLQARDRVIQKEILHSIVQILEFLLSQTRNTDENWETAIQNLENIINSIPER